MLKFIGSFINIFLILIIFLQIPQKNAGLASFANKTNILGSPSSSQRFLNMLTGLAILIYFVIAFTLNNLST